MNKICKLTVILTVFIFAMGCKTQKEGNSFSKNISNTSASTIRIRHILTDSTETIITPYSTKVIKRKPVVNKTKTVVSRKGDTVFTTFKLTSTDTLHTLIRKYDYSIAFFDYQTLVGLMFLIYRFVVVFTLLISPYCFWNIVTSVVSKLKYLLSLIVG